MKTIAILILTLFGLTSFAQKDKAVFADFNADNDVIVAFKSGTVALYSNPDLELMKEVSPGDKKNKISIIKMLNGGNYVLVYDGKVSQTIIYDGKTLSEVGRLKQKSYGIAKSAGKDRLFTQGKIYQLPSMDVVLDISDRDHSEESFEFSPSGKYYLNYEEAGTGGDGDFAIYETTSGQLLGKSTLGDNKSDYNISPNSYFIGDDSVAIVYQKFMEGMNDEDYQVLTVPINIEATSLALKEDINSKVYESTGVEIDYANYQMVTGDFAADVSDDYSYNQMSSTQNVSEDNRFLVLSSKKNKIRLYENDPATTEKQDDYKKSIMVKEIEIPSE
mgnify:FL=1